MKLETCEEKLQRLILKSIRSRYHCHSVKARSGFVTLINRLTLRLREPIWCYWFCDLCTGSTQDLLNKCRGEPSHFRPTHPRRGGGVFSQTVNQYQLFS